MPLRPQACHRGEVLTDSRAPGCHGEPVNRVLSRPMRPAIIVGFTTASLWASTPGWSTAGRGLLGQSAHQRPTHPKTTFVQAGRFLSSHTPTLACDLELHKEHASSRDPAILPSEGFALKGPAPSHRIFLTACQPQTRPMGALFSFAGQNKNVGTLVQNL